MGTKEYMIIGHSAPRFSLKDWQLHNCHRYTCSEIQQEFADCFLEKSNNLRKKSEEIIKGNKEETDFRLKEKIEDIEYRKKELLFIRKEIFLEIDALNLYKERLYDTLSSLRRNALVICEKCLEIREQRIGIDLVHDEVNRELTKESKTIKAAESTIIRTLEQTQEQIRRLKALMYSLDRDLQNKDSSLRIDKRNLLIKENSINLNLYCGKTTLTPSTANLDDWILYTQTLTTEAAKEGNSAKQLRCYINHIINQTIEDLNSQKNLTDAAFLKRIGDTKATKTKLELQHTEIMRQAKEMGLNIERLQKAIEEKEPYMAVAQTRLGNRCQRPGFEMIYDRVESNLIKEISDIQEIVATLKQALAEAQASQRRLLQNQIQIEEEINIKTNTLKIDEVECMTMRQSISFYAY
ncbi:tektin-1 [Prorops nasuta]|uniref:tektin-1 n=1 Tax=Prorops nasuta TaxID=863751 RepID=UPI0034CFC5B9